MRKGTKHLRIASIIQIIIGIIGILITYYLIGEATIDIDAKKALGILILTYASYAFQIIAGLFGLILAKKKSLFTVLLGLLLFTSQLIQFIHADNNILYIIINIVMLIFPYYYLHNAYLNFKKQ